MNKSIRNLVIFVVVALGGGYLGALLNRLANVENSMEGPGTLVWLASPLATVLLLRGLGGDGWKDFGLHLKTSWMWYLVGIGIPALVIALSLALAVLFGTVTMRWPEQGSWAAIGSLLAAGFASAAVKNIFEEFAWRGYLAPRFAAIGMNPFIAYLLTGFIWAAWHIPYYFFFLPPADLARQTSLTAPTLIMFAMLMLPFHAIAYGELRLISKSTWPAWLMHTVANVLSLGLVSGGFIILNGSISSALLSPGTEGIIHGLLMGLIGLGLYLRRKNSNAAPKLETSPTFSHS